MAVGLRVAIAGCGAIAGGYDEASGFAHAYTHAGAVRRHPRFDLVAVAEPREDRRAAFRKAWNVPVAHATVGAMLDQGPFDLLCICVPDAHHGSVVRLALERGGARAILVEKPLAMTAEEAVALADRAADAGVSLYVNYNRRWDPLHERVRTWIADGGLGVLQGGIGHYVRGLRHNGTTMVQTLRRLLSREVRSVRAIRSEPSSLDGDLALDGVLEFSCGTAVWLQAADKAEYGHSVFEIDLMGNRGRVRLHDNGYQVEVSQTAEYRRYPGFRELVRWPELEATWPEGRMRETLLATLDEVADGLDRNVLSLSHARDACRDLRVVEALERSWRADGARCAPVVDSR
ncbi:MAG: Gfo/Idh/MocA family oxidoreductase [Candidatus Sericytochromatia bacterium]|nr:Gfo/Idh/MocA family oxidoreductase [Candidatus Sericytochromatia bacterium]